MQNMGTGIYYTAPVDREASNSSENREFKSNEIYSIGEILKAEFPEPKWVVEGLLPEGFALLGGRPKIGKSWLALQLAMAVGTGTDFLGRTTTAGKVLYFPYEDNPRRLQSRSLQIGLNATANVDFKIVPEPITKDSELSIAMMIDQSKYKLVIIDTAARAFRFDHNDGEKALAAFDKLQRFSLLSGISLLVIDHHRKNSMFESDPVDDIIGSTVKSGMADVIWGLYKHDDKLMLKVIGRDVSEEEIPLNFNKDECKWEVIQKDTVPAPDTKQSDVYDALLELIEEGNLATTRKISERVDIDEPNVSRELKKLVKAGLIRKGKKEGAEQPYLPVMKESD